MPSAKPSSAGRAKHEDLTEHAGTCRMDDSPDPCFGRGDLCARLSRSLAGVGGGPDFSRWYCRLNATSVPEPLMAAAAVVAGPSFLTGGDEQAVPDQQEMEMPADANVPTTQRLLTTKEVAKLLRLDVGRTPQAQRKALERVWAAAQDARADRRLPPLQRIRLGSRCYYEAAVVDAIVKTLSFDF